MKRRQFLHKLGLGMGLAALAAQRRPATAYDSRYTLRFGLPIRTLSRGLDKPPWSDPGAEAVVDHAEWFSAATRDRWRAWGPPARQYPPPAAPHSDIPWLHARILLVASRPLRRGYQHHH